jgi:hypothetical protein
MHDIVTKSQNATLPVVTIDLTNIRRTPDRVFNKQDSFYHNTSRQHTPALIAKYRTPVPVQLSVNLSILAGYQLDLEQIASNFIAYFNPYIILSTKVPTELGPDYDLEVRTKATWNDDLAISTPTELTHADKFRRVGETSFTIDTWIYPEAVDDAKPIYFIEANFHAVSGKILDTSSYYRLSSESFTLSTYPGSTQHVDTITLSGTPTITNVFLSTSGKFVPHYTSIQALTGTQRTFLLYGHQFDKLDYVLLSSNNETLMPGFTSLPSTYYGEVSGYMITSYEVLNKNMLQISTGTSISGIGNVNIITYNAAGWSTTYDVDAFDLFESVQSIT